MNILRTFPLLWIVVNYITLVYCDECIDVSSIEERRAKSARDFTIPQLSHFDGLDCREFYISHNNIVYDITSRISSFSEQESLIAIAGKNITDLISSDNSLRELVRGIIFDSDRIRLHPDVAIVGMLSSSLLFKQYTTDELKAHVGSSDSLRDIRSEELATLFNDDMITGRIDSPILFSYLGKVYDVSYGGAHLYRPGGHYSIYAGVDVSHPFIFYGESSGDMMRTVTADRVDEFISMLKQIDQHARNQLVVNLDGTSVIAHELDGDSDGQVTSGQQTVELENGKMDGLEYWKALITDKRRYPVVGELIAG